MKTNYWIVGRLRWRKNSTAAAVLARDKTTARQYAEALLATYRAWVLEHKKYMLQDVPPGYTLDNFSKAVVEERYDAGTCSYGYECYWYYKNGVEIFGPNGEHITITEPSKKAIERLNRSFRKSDKMTNRMLAGLKGRSNDNYNQTGKNEPF